MSKVSDNVLETIKTCKLCPKPKWQFLLKNYVIWSAFAVAVILGSFSFSVALHMIVTGDWDIYEYSGKSFFEFCLIILPLSWIIVLGAFAFLAFYNWKHTKHGYRYRTYAIMLLSIGASGIFGFLLYNAGFGKKVDAMVSKSLPFYHKSKDDAMDALWLQPDRGLLSGKIVEIQDSQAIVIEDSSGEKWDVQITEETIKKDCCKKKGKSVRIIGKKGQRSEQQKEKEFVAREIRLDDGDDDADDNAFVTREKWQEEMEEKEEKNEE